jgi:hypothetical protein
MKSTEHVSSESHLKHLLFRREKTVANDLRALNNGLLPPSELKKSAHRIDNDQNIILIDGGRDALLVSEELIEISNGKLKTKRTIPRLKEEVLANNQKQDGSPDYVNWLLSIGKIPPENLGVVTEAIVWELSSKESSHISTQFLSGVRRLTNELITNVSSEKSLPNAAWKFAIADYSLSSLSSTTRAGVNCGITAITSGLDQFEGARDSWVESGNAIGSNLSVTTSIVDEIARTQDLPSSEFMESIISNMKLIRIMPYDN